MKKDRYKYAWWYKDGLRNTRVGLILQRLGYGSKAEVVNALKDGSLHHKKYSYENYGEMSYNALREWCGLEIKKKPPSMQKRLAAVEARIDALIQALLPT